LIRALNSQTRPSDDIRAALEPLRLGLCCQFAEQEIRFRTTTAAALARLSPAQRANRIVELCLHNAEALHKAIRYCADAGIGAFRINSQILPVKTHPDVGYEIEKLPAGASIVSALQRCGQLAQQHSIRLTFHPDQYVVLNSPRPEVVARAVADLRAHVELSEWLGADVINIHGGGAYGDRERALAALVANIEQLPLSIRERLTLENDDCVFTPADLLPVCHATGIPLVYDVHHHRCLPDTLSIEEATAAACATWNREPLVHISSPRSGWDGPEPRRHHDYINPDDFPDCWLRNSWTVDIEAKAKELAVLRLAKALLPRQPKSCKLSQVDSRTR